MQISFGRKEMGATMDDTIQSEVTIPLGAFPPENDSTDSDFKQRTPPHNKGSGKNKQKVGRCTSMLSMKVIIILVTVIAILALLFGISAGYFHAQIKQLEAEIKILKAMSTPKPSVTTSCSQGWTTNAEWCYRFSVAESTWSSSHINCSSYGASLFVMETLEERTFINDNKAPAEYWLGLRREAVIGAPWKKPDGSDFDVWFEIKGEGLCASLNDGVVSSTDCDSYRRWICRKPLHAA